MLMGVSMPVFGVACLRRVSSILSLLLAIGLSSCVQLPSHATSTSLSETSAIAASRQNPGVYWLAGDGGDGSVVYAVNLQGQTQAKIELLNAPNKDWEDITTFTYQDEHYLLVGDVGDNRARRDHVVLYVVKEPTLVAVTPATPYPTMALKPDWHFDLVYEDGARDVESIAVDSQTQTLYLLSKRDVPPRLYSSAVKPYANTAVAKFLGEVTAVPTPTEEQEDNTYLPWPYTPMITAMDFSHDEQQLVMINYVAGIIATKTPAQTWLEAMNSPTAVVELPALPQTEAVTFTHDGRNIVVISEGNNQPLEVVEPEPWDNVQ